MTFRNVGWWLTRGVWTLTAGVTVWLVAFSGTDRASTILFAVTLLAVALALLCVARSIDARGVRGKLVWIGRALALLGAAVAISFPAVLYQEIVMLLSHGQTPAPWFPRAIWYQAATIPLIVVPALVALRWARLGGGLFVLDGVYNVLESVYHPFGVIFPEATSSGWIGIPALDVVLQPAFVTAALLLLGSAGAAHGPAARPSTLAPARSP